MAKRNIDDEDFSEKYVEPTYSDANTIHFLTGLQTVRSHDFAVLKKARFSDICAIIAAIPGLNLASDDDYINSAEYLFSRGNLDTDHMPAVDVPSINIPSSRVSEFASWLLQQKPFKDLLHDQGDTSTALAMLAFVNGLGEIPPDDKAAILKIPFAVLSCNIGKIEGLHSKDAPKMPAHGPGTAALDLEQVQKFAQWLTQQELFKNKVSEQGYSATFNHPPVIAPQKQADAPAAPVKKAPIKTKKADHTPAAPSPTIQALKQLIDAQMPHYLESATFVKPAAGYSRAQISCALKAYISATQSNPLEKQSAEIRTVAQNQMPNKSEEEYQALVAKVVQQLDLDSVDTLVKQGLLKADTKFAVEGLAFFAQANAKPATQQLRDGAMPAILKNTSNTVTINMFTHRSTTRPNVVDAHSRKNFGMSFAQMDVAGLILRPLIATHDERGLPVYDEEALLAKLTELAADPEFKVCKPLQIVQPDAKVEPLDAKIEPVSEVKNEPGAAPTPQADAPVPAAEPTPVNLALAGRGLRCLRESKNMRFAEAARRTHNKITPPLTGLHILDMEKGQAPVDAGFLTYVANIAYGFEGNITALEALGSEAQKPGRRPGGASFKGR